MAVEKSSEVKPAADAVARENAVAASADGRASVAPADGKAVAAPADDKAAAAGEVDVAPADGRAASAPASSDVIVDDFGRLVASMSRLLSGFGQLKPLRAAGLGLGEWVALGVLARQEGITSKLMGQRLGIPTQRVAQIFLSLAESGLISIGQPSEDDKDTKVTKLTDAGKTKLEAVNAELKAVLRSAVKARSLSTTLSQLKPLSRIAQPAKPKRAIKKKPKPAKATSGAPASPAKA